MKIMMRISGKLAFLLMLFAFISGSAIAQNKRKEREAKKAAEVKTLVDSGSYVFHAEVLDRVRGGNIVLPTKYGLEISRDTLLAYLAYDFQGYPRPANPWNDPMHFTSTHFTKSTKKQKDAGWKIDLIPTDAKGVKKMYLDIGTDGYASLCIISAYDAPIVFHGYVD